MSKVICDLSFRRCPKCKAAVGSPKRGFWLLVVMLNAPLVSKCTMVIGWNGTYGPSISSLQRQLPLKFFLTLVVQAYETKQQKLSEKRLKKYVIILKKPEFSIHTMSHHLPRNLSPFESCVLYFSKMNFGFYFFQFHRMEKTKGISILKCSSPVFIVKKSTLFENGNLLLFWDVLSIVKWKFIHFLHNFYPSGWFLLSGRWAYFHFLQYLILSFFSRNNLVG